MPLRSLAVAVAVALTLSATALLAQPVGIGGGGALFCPSINPANTSEFYVASDMSELFHTTDYGRSYGLVPFTQVQGGSCGIVRFTSDPSVLYAISTIADVGTPVKSTDGGTTWSPVPGNPDPYETTYAMYVQYDNPDRLLISYYNEMFVSNDGGGSFSSAHVAIDSGSGIVMGGAFFDGDTIYVGTNDGLLVSTNGGASFSVSPVGGIPAGQVIWSFAGAREGATTRFFALTADPANVYVGMFADYWQFMAGVYSLDNAAGSWTSRLANLDPAVDFGMYVRMAENDVDTAYVAGSNDQGVPTVYRTTDAGGSWQQTFQTTNNANIVTGWSGDGGDRGWWYGEVVFGVDVARGDASRLVITDYGFVHVSADGGASWRQAYLSAADENPAGQQTPTGKSYRGIGLEDTTCWQVMWVDASNVWAAFSDIRAMRSTDGGSSWSFDYTGLDGNSTYRIVQHASGTLYAGKSSIHDMYQSTRLQDSILDQPDGDGKIIMSSDGGASWTDMHVFGHPVFWLALDPTDPDRMYASVVHSTLGGIYVSNDIQNGAAATFTKLANPPRTEGHPATIVVLDDGSVVATYSGRRDPGGDFTPSSGCFLYSGGSWSDVSDPGMTYWTKDVVVDPADATQSTWYVGVFSGWGGPPNGLGGLYRTTDRGGSWTRIWNQDRVTSVTFHPSIPGDAYVTTETAGLWHSTDIAPSTPTLTLVTTYPFRQPERVFYNPGNPGQVWVTSFGNGIRILGGGGSAGGPTIVAGPGPGPANAPNVRGFDATGLPNGATDFAAYGSTGYGVNVSGGNVRSTTAGQADVLTGPGPGAIYGPQVRGFQTDGTPIAKINYFAYGTLRYGVNVTSGLLDADGYDEILSAAGPGVVFGPHVRGWNHDDTAVTAIAKINFFAFSTLRYGVQASGAGVDGDAFAEILCAPGPSSVFGAQVRGFDYDDTAVTAISKVNFTPYPTHYGAHVNGGDLDRDGIEEILVAPGPDPVASPRVRGFDYDGVAIVALPGVDFDGIGGGTLMGATLDALDVDGDTWAEVVVGTGYDGAGGSPRVRGWNVDGGTAAPIPGLDFMAYAGGMRYGVNVAADLLAP